MNYDSVIALLRTAIDMLSDMKKASPDVPRGFRLPVPWMSQLGKDAAYSNNDCGPAVVAMLLRMAGKTATVDQVSKATGLAPGYKFTLPAHLITAAAAFGLNLKREQGIGVAMLRDEVSSGSPVIVLVHYGSLKARYDPKFVGGHWIVVVGYTERGLLYHDPYWPDTRGQCVEIEDAALDAALEDCALDKNTPRQGLVKA